MTTLSIITHSRCDNYFNSLLYRFETTLNRHGLNLASLPNKDFGEIVLCDWGSPPDYKLINNLKLKTMCKFFSLITEPESNKIYFFDNEIRNKHKIDNSIHQIVLHSRSKNFAFTTP